MGAGMAHANLDDVARLAGVSAKTVSRVINDEFHVAPQTVERVRRAISDLGYVPNAAARNLSRGRAMGIGLVVGWEVYSAFTGKLVDSALSRATQRGYDLSLFLSNAHVVDRVGKALLGKRIDGVIMDSEAATNERLVSRLASLNIPYVVVHPHHADGPGRASFVRVDNFLGSRQATEYLIALGHRAIGLTSFPIEASSFNERAGGYREALEEAGIGYHSDWVLQFPGPPIQIGLKGAQHLLSSHPEITAIFAATDEIAMGVVAAVWRMGMRVPQDISVIGFDDSIWASAISPPLTTVRQPLDDLARSAVDLVIEMLEDPNRDTTDLILPTSLVVRDSCQPPGPRIWTATKVETKHEDGTSSPHTEQGLA